MHCGACNEFLSDDEAKVKTVSGNYLNLCLTCYKPVADDIELDPETVPKGWFYLSVSGSEASSDDDEFIDDDGYGDYWDER